MEHMVMSCCIFLRRELSLMSRTEALHYRELVARFSVKKPTVETIVDNLREVETEIIAAYHNMFEASLIARHLNDLRIVEGDHYLLYLRNLPEKVAEHCQLTVGTGTVAQLLRAATEHYARSRASAPFERTHAVKDSMLQLWQARTLGIQLSKASQVQALWQAWSQCN